MNGRPGPAIRPPDAAAAAAARARQGQLTKPAGALGRLEEIAEIFAGWQGRSDPVLERICIRVFAADHGVCVQGVSAYPQAVTGQMVANLASGGAAVSVLARQLGADLEIINLGTVDPLPPCAGVRETRIAPGTRDLSLMPAMTPVELEQALAIGEQAVPAGPLHLFIGGEMGIGNSTAAAALYSVLLDLPAASTVGPGSGVTGATLAHKRAVVERALALHGPALMTEAEPTLAALRRLGGFEIAALASAYITCARRGIGVLVDGYISTAAALCALRLEPAVRAWLLFAHVSAEPAHRTLLQKLGVAPLLDLQMRLGEGSGAALAVPLLRAALDLHNQMATFADAGVSDRG